jgi:uncharacterized membrane protein
VYSRESRRQLVAGCMRSTSHHPRTWQRLIAAPLLLSTLLIAGCTSSFVYNRLDTLASWYFEGLVSLNDDQSNQLRDWLSQTLAWHRRSELTRYAGFLNDVSVAAQQPGDRRSYDEIRARFQGLIDDLIGKTAPEASQLLLHLSPKQVEELLENLEEKTREGAKEGAEAVASNDWHPEQLKDVTRQMKRWTGAVTPEQKRIIESHVAHLEPTFAEWADSQRSWREALREVLLAKDVAESAEPSPQLLQLLEDPDSKWTDAYRQKVARNRERYQVMMMELDATLSPKQRQHLQAELSKLSQQLTRLAQT